MLTSIQGPKNFRAFLRDVTLNSLTKEPITHILIRLLKYQGFFNLRYVKIKPNVIKMDMISHSLRKRIFLLNFFSDILHYISLKKSKVVTITIAKVPISEINSTLLEFYFVRYIAIPMANK